MSGCGMNCRSCGSEDVKQIGRCKEYEPSGARGDVAKLIDDPGELYYCQTCGFGFRHPSLSGDELKRLYKEMPEGQWEEATHRRSDWCKAISFVDNHFAGLRQVSVLEVGANHGTFLDALPKTWNKFAVEPSQAGQETLINLGVTILSDDIETSDSERVHERFDLIFLFDVFEHLQFPEKALASMAELLVPGGRLIISTGNMDHWAWKKLKGQYWYLDTFQHISFASRKFFEHFSSGHRMVIEAAKEISHTKGRWSNRLDDIVTALYFIMRIRGGIWQSVSGAILLVPRYAALRHKSTVPFLVHLKDHLFVVLRKPEIQG